MGSFNIKSRKTYQNLCHLTEKGVLTFMRDYLTSKYGIENIVYTQSYVIAYGNIPVALVAHADTVFHVQPRIDEFYYDQEKDVIWNPCGAGADDRAGVFSIVHILRSTNLRPHVIITTGEESGCIGASKLISQIPVFPKELKFMIQLDRRGHNDSVYYDCANYTFEDWINTYGFETRWGTFTDISVLAPMWKVAAVNFSIGYEDEHHEIEHLHVDWMFETIEKTIKILNDVRKLKDKVPVYEYIDGLYNSGYSLFKYKYGGKQHSAWYDYDDIIMPKNHDHCYMCNQINPIEDMIPIWHPNALQAYPLCMECYSDLVDRILWCAHCGKAYYVSNETYKNTKDVNNWICEVCENELRESTRTVQQSDNVLAESELQSDGTQNGSDIRGVGQEQSPIHSKDGRTDLRDSGDYLF